MQRTTILMTAAALAVGCNQLPKPVTPDACQGKYCIGWSPNGVDAAVVICAGTLSQLDATVQTLRSTFPRSVITPNPDVKQ